MFNYFSIAGLCIGLINLGLAILISLSAKTKLHRVWSFVNYSISLWGFGMFISGWTKDHEVAFIGWRIFNVGIILISVIYYHVIHLFCKLRSNKFLIYNYSQGIFFILLAVFTNLLFGDKLFFSFNQFYFFRASIFHHILMINFSVIVGKSFYELYKNIRSSSGISNIQGKYLFLAMMFGFGGGLNTAPAAWGFNVYPYGQILVCFYGTVATYAILKYQIMDIRVAITRFGILILVYSLVLGIPFGMAIWGKSWLINFLGDNWFWCPMLILLMFATAGPSLFLYFQRKAENQLLQEERRIQILLKKASAGISSIKDLDQLLKSIIDILRKTLNLNSVDVYLLDAAINAYVLKAPAEKRENAPMLSADCLLTQRFKEKKSPIVYEEVKLLLDNQNEDGPKAKEIIAKMDHLTANILIPMLRENVLIGFIVLGSRKQKEMYSADMIDILSVVGNEVALAVENAIFYEESGKDWTQRAHDSRLKTMGAMGTGIAHQIRNRLNAISSQLILLQDVLNSFDITKSTPEDFQKMRDECNKIIEKIFKDIEHGAEIVESIKNYAKQTEAKPQVVVFDQAVTGAIRLLRLSRKSVSFTLSENYDKSIMLWTNFSMLQDMFYNIFDNSNDAVVSKQEEINRGALENKNEDFKVRVSANPNGKMCEIVIEDNGMGIKKEHLEEEKGVNVMYFTTKGATKGTGMGVALMRQFVKYNGGKMKIESEYTQWTKITISLPLATEEQRRQFKEKNGGNV